MSDGVGVNSKARFNGCSSLADVDILSILEAGILNLRVVDDREASTENPRNHLPYRLASPATTDKAKEYSDDKLYPRSVIDVDFE